jgi:hypothetical protein
VLKILGGVAVASELASWPEQGAEMPASNHRDFSQVEELAYAVEHEQSAHLILSIWFEITFADVERQIHEHSITTLCVLDVSLLVT